ncbi:MAG TPA: helicase-exonuclease AddAB subunit AddB [Peptococcaceae bacterium]|nr:helicase-exonuclease AddAB subunit AddB [Peptococcaceae bacterium]
MSLRFIYGRSGSGKTYRCLQEIKEKIAAGAANSLVLLVPEQYTFQAERDLIKVLETGGILQVEVLSFRRLAFRIFNEAGGITYPHIHPAGKNMIIYRILSKAQKELKVFARSAERQGFVSTISTLITEFKRYNVTPEDLKAVADKLEEGNSLKDKLKELHLIYARYEETLALRYRDNDDDLTLAAAKLEQTDLYAGAEIWIDGFAGFTPQEYKVISKLLLLAKRVNISLCTDKLEERGYNPDTDIFAAVKAAYRRLVKIARESGIEIEPAVFLHGNTLLRFQTSPELSHLERNLYAYPYKTFLKPTKDISLLAAVNIFAEIEAAARDIIRLTRDEGFRFRDIGVVARNLAGYERLIEVIFTEYEIPFFLDRKVNITNHPLVRMILSLFEIFIDNWSYEAVFSYLKTGLTGLEREDIDRLENYVLACGIRGNRWAAEEDWRMSPNFLPDEKDLVRQEKMLQEINSIRQSVVKPLKEFRQRTKGRNTALEWCTAIYDFLVGIGVPARLEKFIRRFQDSGQLNLANEYSQVWNILMQVLEQTVEVMGEETIGLEKFANVLKVGLAEYQIGLIPASLDEVLVGSVDRSKSHELKALYVLGVNDGVFPSSSMEEGILSDAERFILHQAGVELAKDTKTQAFEEQYLVYKTLTIPGKYLRLSWPIADQEGRSMRPSLIISRLKKLFPAIEVQSDLVGEKEQTELELIVARHSAFREMITALRKKADGEEISPLWETVYHWFVAQEAWQEKCRAACTAFTYKNIAQPVSREKVTALFGSPVYTSVSRLEKYTACPFSFYVQYGLKAQERKIYRLSPPDIGTFMHAVIERFSRLLAEQKISWRDVDRKWCEDKVSEIVEEMLEKMQGSGLAASKRYTMLALRLKRVVARALWLIAEQMRRSSFEPVGYEVGFGDNEDLPAIVLELDSGQKIKLTGRIDRIDALRTEEGTYLRIIDYKSGSKDFKLADAYYGLQIQLLTYLDALWENPGPNIEGQVLPGGVLYFKIDDPLVKGLGSEEEIEKALMKALKMKGLLLADVKLLKAMDKTMEGSSLIIPASLTKQGQIGKSSSVASLAHFKVLRKYLRKLLKGLGEEIMRGKVEISPYKKKSMTSCRYCNFTSICQFDPSLKENTYRLLPERKDEEVWKLITEEQISIDKGGQTDG